MMRFFFSLWNQLFQKLGVHFLHNINENVFLYIFNLKDSLKVKGFFEEISLENIAVNCRLLKKKLGFYDFPFSFKKISLKSCHIQFFFSKRTIEISLNEVSVVIDATDNDKENPSCPIFGEAETFWFYRKLLKVKYGVKKFLKWKKKKKKEEYRFDTISWITKRFNIYKLLHLDICEKWKKNWKIHSKKWFPFFLFFKKETRLMELVKNNEKSYVRARALLKESSILHYFLNWIFRYIPNVHLKCYNIKISLNNFLKWENDIRLYIEQISFFYENDRFVFMWPLKNQNSPSFSLVINEKFQEKNNTKKKVSSKPVDGSFLHLKRNLEEGLNYQGVVKNAILQIRSGRRRNEGEKLQKKKKKDEVKRPVGEHEKEKAEKGKKQKKTLKKNKLKETYCSILKGSFNFEINVRNKDNPSINIILFFAKGLRVCMNTESLLMLNEFVTSSNEEDISWLLNYYKPKQTIREFFKKGSESVSSTGIEEGQFKKNKIGYLQNSDVRTIHKDRKGKEGRKKAVGNRIFNYINKNTNMEKDLFRCKKEQWKTYFLKFVEDGNDIKKKVSLKTYEFPSDLPFFDIHEKYTSIKNKTKKHTEHFYLSRRQYFSDTDIKLYEKGKGEATKKKKKRGSEQGYKNGPAYTKGAITTRNRYDVAMRFQKEKKTINMNINKQGDKSFVSSSFSFSSSSSPSSNNNNRLYNWNCRQEERFNLSKKKVIRQWWFHLYKCVLFKVLKKKKKLKEVLIERIQTRTKYMTIIKTFFKSENGKLINYFEKNINELVYLQQVDENIKYIFHLYKYFSATEIIYWHLLALQDFRVEEEEAKSETKKESLKETLSQIVSKKQVDKTEDKKKNSTITATATNNSSNKNNNSNNNSNHSHNNIYQKEFQLFRKKYINRFFFYQKYQQCFPFVHKFNNEIRSVEHMFARYKNEMLAEQKEKKQVIKMNDEKNSERVFINDRNEFSSSYESSFSKSIKNVNIQVFLPHLKVCIKNSLRHIRKNGTKLIQIVIHQLGKELSFSQDLSLSLCFHSLYVKIFKKPFIKIENKETPTTYTLIHNKNGNSYSELLKKNRIITDTYNCKREQPPVSSVSPSPNKKERTKDSKVYQRSDSLNIKKLFECPLRNDKVSFYKGVAYLIRKKIMLDEHRRWGPSIQRSGKISQWSQHFWNHETYFSKMKKERTIVTTVFQKLTQRLSIRNLINVTNILSLLHIFKTNKWIDRWMKGKEVDNCSERERKERGLNGLRKKGARKEVYGPKKSLKQYLLRVKNKVLRISNNFNSFQIIVSPYTRLFSSNSDVCFSESHKYVPRFLYFHFYVTRFEIFISKHLFCSIKKEYDLWKRAMSRYGLNKQWVDIQFSFSVPQKNLYFLNNILNNYLKCQRKNPILIHSIIRRIKKNFLLLEKEEHPNNFFFLLNNMRNDEKGRKALVATLEKLVNVYTIIKLKIPNICVFIEKRKRILENKNIFLLILPVDMFQSKRIIETMRLNRKKHMRSKKLYKSTLLSKSSFVLKTLSPTLTCLDKEKQNSFRFFFYFDGLGFILRFHEINDLMNRNRILLSKLQKKLILHISNFFLIYKEYFMHTCLFFLIFHLPKLKKRLQILEQNCPKHFHSNK